MCHRAVTVLWPELCTAFWKIFDSSWETKCFSLLFSQFPAICVQVQTTQTWIIVENALAQLWPDCYAKKNSQKSKSPVRRGFPWKYALCCFCHNKSAFFWIFYVFWLNCFRMDSSWLIWMRMVCLSLVSALVWQVQDWQLAGNNWKLCFEWMAWSPAVVLRWPCAADRMLKSVSIY